MAAAVNFNEFARLRLQNRLDASRTQSARNRLGQFATPAALATEMMEYAKTLTPPNAKVRFLDPAFGTGSFYSALLSTFSSPSIDKALGYEIDEAYGQGAIRLWADTDLRLTIADFTTTVPPEFDRDKANLVICNPPYVRHHHLKYEEKARLRLRAEESSRVRLNGLSGLYCYFLCIAHQWMADDAIAGWLIPSEFMYVNYGQAVRNYLLNCVKLVRIHRFDPYDIQFDDALVSSVLVWFRKAKPPPGHAVKFSYGGSLTNPQATKIIPVERLYGLTKWNTTIEQPEPSVSVFRKATLSNLFEIKRGLATGANGFFILTQQQALFYQLPHKFLTPILPSPKHLPGNEIEADSAGCPKLQSKLFLLSCNLPDKEVSDNYPALWKYLQRGIELGVSERYLCKRRDPWYAQEHRPAPPLLCTYMGRQGIKGKNPFRFVLNHSCATVANVYLALYPKPHLAEILKSKPELLRAVWQALNEISSEMLKGEGRVYGGGLYKMEPAELGNVPADNVIAALQESLD